MTTINDTPKALGTALIRYGYAPFMLIGLNGAAITVTACGAPKYELLLVLAAAIAASFLAERVIPYDPQWNHDHADTWRDRVHAAVNETTMPRRGLGRPKRLGRAPTQQARRPSHPGHSI